MASRTILKGYFVTGAKPTQGQFASFIDSYYHKDEDTIPSDKVSGLTAALAGKAATADVTNEAGIRAAADDDLQTQIDELAAGGYTLPVATPTVLGGVKQGSGVTIAVDGTISATGGGGGYTLPVATPTVLGGVKQGSGVVIAGDGTIDTVQLVPNTTGTVLTFTADKVYGSKATPETGNITGNITGALLGVTNMVIHNNGSAPTFDSKFHKLSGSGDYVTGVVNYIYCTFIAADTIIYAINQ